jgi:hypothetical protein
MEARKPELSVSTDIMAHSNKSVGERIYKGQECRYAIHTDLHTSITLKREEGFLKYCDIFIQKWLCGFNELGCNEIRNISLSYRLY